VLPEEAATLSHDGKEPVCANATWLPAASTATVALTAPLDPNGADRIRRLGEMVSVGSTGCPAWVTVTDWPATVSVPVRAALLVFACTCTVTMPLPVPFAPELMLNQPLFDAACHWHVPPAETCTNTLLASCGVENDVLLSA
jgi:hypothetical protein